MVYLNKYDGGSKWNEQWKVDVKRPLDPAVEKQRDVSLSLSSVSANFSLTLVVGVPGVPGSSGAAGYAYLYRFDTSQDVVSLMSSQTLSTAEEGGYFGYSVSVSLNTIAVGDPYHGE